MGPNAGFMLFAQPFAGITQQIGTTLISRELVTAQYLTNISNPNEFPSPEAVIAGYLRGYISPENTNQMLLARGVCLLAAPPNVVSGVASTGWKAVEQMMLPRPTLDYAYSAYVRGIIDDKQFRELRNHHADRYGTMLGYVDFSRSPLDWTHIASAWYRGTLQASDIKKQIKRIGGWKDDIIDVLQKNLYVIPPISDQIRFVVREAYNPEQVAKLGLDEEYEQNPQYEYWASRSGLQTIPANTFPGQAEEINWAKMYWRAHWTLPSPTQVYVMLQRLRPEAKERYTTDDLKPEPVTIDDVRSLLKANDYPPIWRDRLAAISYHPLTRVDIRRFYLDGTIDEDEVYQCNRDIGYDERNAKIITEWLKNQKKKKDEKEKEKMFAVISRRLAAKILQSYYIGAVSRTEAFQGLVGTGTKPEVAGYYLDEVDIRLHNEYVMTYVKSIKREYMLGLYNEEDVRRLLIEAGIEPIAAQRYVTLWARLMRMPRRIASAKQVLDWFKRGLLQEDEVVLRLHNLGYSNTDQLLFLQAAYQDIERERLKQQAAQARNDAQKARATKNAMKQEERDRLHRRRELSRMYGEDDIKRWFKLGLFNEQEARQALEAIDFEQKAIDLRIAEWQNS